MHRALSQVVFHDEHGAISSVSGAIARALPHGWPVVRSSCVGGARLAWGAHPATDAPQARRHLGPLLGSGNVPRLPRTTLPGGRRGRNREHRNRTVLQAQTSMYCCGMAGNWCSPFSPDRICICRSERAHGGPFNATSKCMRLRNSSIIWVVQWGALLTHCVPLADQARTTVSGGELERAHEEAAVGEQTLLQPVSEHEPAPLPEVVVETFLHAHGADAEDVVRLEPGACSAAPRTKWRLPATVTVGARSAHHCDEPSSLVLREPPIDYPPETRGFTALLRVEW